MTATAWLHINGTDYELAGPAPDSVDDAAFQQLQARVERVLAAESGPTQRFDIVRGEGHTAVTTSLMVRPGAVHSAAVWVIVRKPPAAPVRVR